MNFFFFFLIQLPPLKSMENPDDFEIDLSIHVTQDEVEKSI